MITLDIFIREKLTVHYPKKLLLNNISEFFRYFVNRFLDIILLQLEKKTVFCVCNLFICTKTELLFLHFAPYFLF